MTGISQLFFVISFFSSAFGGEWRLVGAYDATAVAAAAPESDSAAVLTEAPVDPFSWRPDPVLLEYCGTPRAPRGMGVMESVAVSEGLTPALILLLRSEDPTAEPLRDSDLAVSVVRSADSIDPAGRMELRPAVEPRRIRLAIDNQMLGEADRVNQWTEVVRTQLGIQLCLEHMLGRAWSGGDEKRVREAFLLTRPQVAGAVDRRYLVGQQEPVGAYLGPPDACEVDGQEVANTAGQVSAELVPADVWQGRVRPCEEDMERKETNALPLRVFGEAAAQRQTGSTWSEMRVVLRRGVSEVPTVEVVYNEEVLLEPTLLLSREQGASNDTYGVERMEDLLGRVPHEFPLIEREGRQYTVLVIPEWQLAEARQRRERMDRNPTKTMQQAVYRAPRKEMNGVAWILQHPELLRVQVRPEVLLEEPEWPDLAVAIQGGFLGVRAWGYTSGLLGGRSPVILPQVEPIHWEQVVLAQRGQQQSYIVAAFVILCIALLSGLRRLPELWRPIPEERADYWPGVGDEPEDEQASERPGGVLSSQGLQ
jgi:hypothetical protein